MTRGSGSFSGKLSRHILRRLGIDHTVTKSKLTSSLAIGLLLALGALSFVAPFFKWQVPYKDFWITLAGALVGSAVGLITSRVLSQDEELLSLVAAGSMTRSSLDPRLVRMYQKTYVIFHTTRTARGVVGLSRGFRWTKAALDLSAPAPGLLMGTYRTRDPVSEQEECYVAEGYLRHGILVLHIIADPGQEDIEATFTFLLTGMPGKAAYGSGYHVTNASKPDLALSPAILCDGKDQLCIGSANNPLPLGLIPQGKDQSPFDNAWWNNHRVKILPRILTQISATHANVGDINGEWLFRYMLVYDACEEPVHLVMSIHRSGARYLITPSSRTIPAEVRQPNVHGSIEWMAEMRALHPECMTGRWWGVEDYDRSNFDEHPDYENSGVLSTEGTLMLNVDVNKRGLFGHLLGSPRIQQANVRHHCWREIF